MHVDLQGSYFLAVNYYTLRADATTKDIAAGLGQFDVCPNLTVRPVVVCDPRVEMPQETFPLVQSVVFPSLLFPLFLRSLACRQTVCLTSR